jgi:hypothetical protein
MSRKKAKSEMVYMWKGGAHIRGSLDAQAVGSRLESLRQLFGQLTPEVAVEDARPVDALLHPAFEWDDVAAAEQFRLVQAREIIRSVVVIPSNKPDATPIRAFVVIGEIGDRSYTSTYAAMADPELRQQILARALRELRQWQAKYRELEELASVFEVVERVAA